MYPLVKFPSLFLFHFVNNSNKFLVYLFGKTNQSPVMRIGKIIKIDNYALYFGISYIIHYVITNLNFFKNLKFNV